MGDVFTVFAGDIVVGVGSQGIAALGALQRHFCKNVYVLLLWGFFFKLPQQPPHLSSPAPTRLQQPLGRPPPSQPLILTKETRVVSFSS